MYSIIDPEGDLVVKVVQKEQKEWNFKLRALVVTLPYKVCEMKVNRKTFVNSSRDFEKLVRRSYKKDKVELYHNVEAMEVWLKALHKTLGQTDMLNISIREVIEIVYIGREFLLEIEVLQPWFSNWYEAEMKTVEAQTPRELDHLKKVYKLKWLHSLIVVCYVFDHPQGFAFASMHLAYDSPGHVEFDDNIPYRIGYQINAARCTMVNEIDRTMAYALYYFQDTGCTCSKAATFAWVGALRKAKVFNGRSLFDILDGFKFRVRNPFGILGRRLSKDTQELRSVHQQAINLADFNYTPPENACAECREVIGPSDTATLRSYIMKEFHGLCLDCITSSKQGSREGADPYWSQKGGMYGSRCRMSHDQTTWYFSFNGRPNDRDAWGEAYRARKDERKDLAEKERKDLAEKERKDLAEKESNGTKEDVEKTFGDMALNQAVSRGYEW